MITREEEKKGVSLSSFLGWIGFGYDFLMIMWILIYLCIVSQKKKKFMYYFNLLFVFFKCEYIKVVFPTER